MKKYEKCKFWFLWNDGSKKEPKEGELFCRMEWRLKQKFPFIFHTIIVYELRNSIWVELPE
jgi:hypothetical protein